MDSTEETPAATPDAPLGLRERKKAATRQAVHEAAMRLTREHGLDHVTVEAIADAAEISRRTFSNYFAGRRTPSSTARSSTSSASSTRYATAPPRRPTGRPCAPPPRCSATPASTPRAANGPSRPASR
ncbi:TetR/AcrR family transcriptional regulator [Actinomadura keratinilytica]